MTDASKHHMRKLLVDFRDRFAVPALGAAVVTRGGAITVDVVGNRERGGSDPVTIDDQWHIGSCAKAMTAALYARLVEQGDAEWDVPVRAFFPDLIDHLDPGWSDATVDEVLVCRSGMRANLSQPEMREAWEDTSPTTEQRTRAVVSALSRPPNGRGAFRYSNLGYVVVGAAIDRIVGVPLKTPSTSICLSHSASPRRVLVHHRTYGDTDPGSRSAASPLVEDHRPRPGVCAVTTRPC